MVIADSSTQAAPIALDLKMSSSPCPSAKATNPMPIKAEQSKHLLAGHGLLEAQGREETNQHALNSVSSTA